MDIRLADGTTAKMNDITDINQQLKLYDGTIETAFSIDGKSV